MYNLYCLQSFKLQANSYASENKDRLLNHYYPQDTLLCTRLPTPSSSHAMPAKKEEIPGYNEFATFPYRYLTTLMKLLCESEVMTLVLSLLEHK